MLQTYDHSWIKFVVTELLTETYIHSWFMAQDDLRLNACLPQNTRRAATCCRRQPGTMGGCAVCSRKTGCLARENETI